MWLANLFATRRELKRLASRNRALWLRVSSLEEKNERLSNLLLERDFLFVDRALTAILKTYAMSDEAEHKVRQNTPTDTQKADAQKQYNEQKAAYLQARKLEIYGDARKAGATPAQAEQKYLELEPTFINQFENGF